MAKLIWDSVGDRFYETGIDRGVLYLSDGTGIAWNGLKSSSIEQENVDSTPLYFDGEKTFDLKNHGNFSATITAVTYPDEFVSYTGLEFYNGIYIDNQPDKTFGLSYRTFIGNDSLESSYGYKIHIMYNLSAIPQNISYESLNDSSQLIDFSWKLNSQPQYIAYNRSSSHFVIDSTKVHPSALTEIENVLYGTNNSEPRLPDVSELLSYFTIVITDNNDGTWTATGPSYYISMLDSNTFQITNANAIYIDGDTYAIASTLEGINPLYIEEIYYPS